MGDENQINPGPTTTTTVAAQMRKPEPNAQADEAMKKYRATMESGGATPAVSGNGTTIIPTRPMDLSAAFPPPAEHIMQFFASAHLPPRLQAVSGLFAILAEQLVAGLPRNPERTKALDFLLLAKDAAVRALVAKP